MIIFWRAFIDDGCLTRVFFLLPGLATTYAINTVLAVLAAFKAPERGQPLLLWVPKTFLVGGLAYDQLLQLPTLEEISAKNSRKGARAPKR
jgi:hypothetical protein